MGLRIAKVAGKPAALALAALLFAAAIPAAPQTPSSSNPGQTAAAPSQTATRNAATPTPAPPGNSLTQIVNQAVQQALAQVAAQQAGRGQAGPVGQQLTPEQMEQALEIGREAIRPGGPATLGILVSILVPLGFFTMLVLIAFIISRRRQAQIRAQAELRRHLIDKFSSGAELAAFLESKGGQQFFQELQQPAGGQPRFLPAGMVFTMLGLAFLALTVMRHQFVVPGVLLLGIGIGLLLSAGIMHKLASGGGGNAAPGADTRVPSLPQP